jgi:hypothetical protein
MVVQLIANIVISLPFIHLEHFNSSQLDHIQGNVLGNECKFGVIESYWLDFHKLIYIEFELPNTLPMYNKKPLMFPLKWNICDYMCVNIIVST